MGIRTKKKVCAKWFHPAHSPPGGDPASPPPWRAVPPLPKPRHFFSCSKKKLASVAVNMPITPIPVSIRSTAMMRPSGVGEHCDLLRHW